MSTETGLDYWRCPDGNMHDWIYRGRPSQLYRCRVCDLIVTKAALKEHTDTDG